MAINYPGSIDNGTSLPNPSSTDDTDSPSLADGQSLQNEAVIALETKVGIGASDPTANANTVLTSDGTSTSWQPISGTFVGSTTGTGAFVLQTGATIDNAILNSPTINNPTFTGSFGNITVGTLTATGNITGNSNLSIAGNATITGNLTVSGTINSNQVTQGWNAIGTTLTYSANNGNKEFVVTTGTDQTGVISPGMKLKVARGTTPPTQCMAFASASSQYATKASPSGISFTSAFTCESWIYLLSYPASDAAIEGRDSTGGSGSGFEFDVRSTGQLQVFWRNASGTSAFVTYQSIPLRTWVHVAAAATTATPTAVLYINGTLSPSTSTATGASSLVQSTAAIALGKGNANTAYLNAYLSETRLWSVAQTQANIQANMAINLTGSESNLVGLWRGNGNFNDLTSNANTLTATNGAIATQAANPYNATEYGIITAVSSTTLTIYTGQSNTIPNQTLSNPQYATVRSPFGFPASTTNWVVESLYIAAETDSVTSSTWVNALNARISVPIGSWRVKYIGNLEVATINILGRAILSLGATTGVSVGPTSYSESYSSAGLIRSTAAGSVSFYPSTQTLVYASLSANGSATVGWDNSIDTGNSMSLYITAECGYI